MMEKRMTPLDMTAVAVALVGIVNGLARQDRTMADLSALLALVAFCSIVRHAADAARAVVG